MAVRTGRIYDKPSAKDGYRLLIMRLWPRGVRRDAIDEWQKELGPSRELLDGFLHGGVGWAAYTRRYRAEMLDKPELLDAVRKLSKRRTVTLLCGCADESRCHRTLLREMLKEHK